MIDVIDYNPDPERSYGDQHYIPVCDFCGKALDVEWDFESAFESAVESMKLCGWKSNCDENGTWINMCPCCARLYDRDAPRNMFAGIGRTP